MGFYNDDLAGNTPLVANKWYNIAWVFDSTTHTQSIYVNGQLDASRVTNGGPSGSPSNFLGTGETALIGNSCCGAAINGLIEDVGVYNTALSQASIQALVQTPEPSSIIALVGLCGMGLIGLILHRRRAAARVAA